MALSNETSQSKPNVVFMLGDNVGWGDLRLLRRPRSDASASMR